MKHYQYKSFEEYCLKIKRGVGDSPKNISKEFVKKNYIRLYLENINDEEKLRLLNIKKNCILLLFLIDIYIINNKLKINISHMTTNLDKNITFNYSNSRSSKIIKNVRKKLLEYLSNCIKKNITRIKNIFLGQKMRFGNKLILLQRVIFFCEILGCKNIILDKHKNWFLKNAIIMKKHKMTIKVDEKKNLRYYRDIIIDKTWNFYYYQSLIIPQKRINILKNEILRNLPTVMVNKDDLYIYIRSGDIFTGTHPHPNYIQPPSCYYKRIVDNFFFHKIYIIAEDKSNPVIDDLLAHYKFIIYNINSLKIDIAYLVNAYNILGGGETTFFHQIILMNDHLQLLFKYNAHYKNELVSKKFKVRNINNLTIFEIFAPKEYLANIHLWRNSDKQREFMISFIC